VSNEVETGGERDAIVEAIPPKVGANNAGTDDPRSKIRRRDRGKEDGWVRDLMLHAPWGFMATVGDEGQPSLNSNLFVYDDQKHCIYLHTHRTGRTRKNMEVTDRVAFSVAAMGRLLPADEALEFSVEYCGVNVFGRGYVVEDIVECKTALQALLDKYAPHLAPDRDYRSTTDDELRRTAVYRIEIETWSGKQKEAEIDFPGAFEVKELSVPFPGRSDAPE